ncbi:MAG: alanine--tRNA ligase [Candidatus Omnitrophica bacterium]|nr:alanine--tRNA ligase [Candidatus Omnitrophota bacterium]
MQADLLRDKFLNFFKSRKHKIVPSDSLVPSDDPTVLFTPAGMNQFKKEFMGFDAGFKRATTAQRCLRTDDLDKVGKTSAHHTFFEMLGNFSFGDYFKEEAISYAWEFLTQELKIDKEKLWVSVYKDDDEAYQVWREKVGIPVSKIVKLGDKDNFWPSEAKTKGPNGPCGPCSEIFFDFGLKAGCGSKDCDPSCSCGRFVEIWNLVFTQFNRKEDASLVPLPNKNIDTGMGLERLAAIMQGKQNNFETELFQPIIAEIKRFIEAEPKDSTKLIYAIADHIRAVVFSIYDGISPSNEGRGYIARKIIRKSVLHLRSLGIKKPFLYKLVVLVAQIMHKPYPDLKDKQEDIARVILNEENNFINTLSLSSVLVDNEIEKVKLELENDPKVEGATLASAAVSGALGIAAFRLYDTHGIPLEITRDELGLRCISVNDNFEAAFQRELDKQKNLSKSFSKMKGDVFDIKGLGLKLKDTNFIGYKEHTSKTKILAILKDAREVNEALVGDNFQIVLEETPFYAESGGQVGDTGELLNGNNVFQVLDTQKIDNLILHIGKVISGVFKKNDSVVAKIDIQRRQNIARNHTATHILQAALRQVLGGHVQQQGSLVGDEKFRFDFTHFKGLSKDELARVEEVANGFIANNCAVDSKEMALIDAKKTGALAFFEEKYSEFVRVIIIGDFSKELCGGIHLTNIKEIGLIKILGEGSVASGIRRIEGVTAGFAEQFIKDEEEKVIEESNKRSKLEELKAQEKKRSAQVRNSLSEDLPRLIEKNVKINGINTVFSLEENLDMQALRFLADKIKEKLSSVVVVLASQDELQKKAFLVVAVTPDLLSRGIDAGALIRKVAPLIGGSGGGRCDFAQAGGSNPEALAQALEELKKVVNKL